MKIAYISFVKDYSLVVEKRMHEMALAAKDAGIDDMDFYYLNRSRQETDELIRFVRIRENLFPFNYYGFLLRRYDIIEKSIHLKRYDYVILRYPNGDPSGIEFASKYNIITEHHTMEIPEYLSHLKSEVSPIIRVLKMTRLKLERGYGHEILSHVKGIIGVTDEIMNAELNRVNKVIPSATIPNGIAVKNITQTGFKPFDGKTLDLIMIAGSFSPWHGLDRIISSRNLYRGNVKINLHIVGNIKKADLRHITSDFSAIKFYGFKDGAELDEIMKNMNVAISTLALFRKDMNEACTLKTREYTARGIPFVLAYKDTDLRHVDENHRFYLFADNNDLPIDMDRIIDFARQMSKKSYKQSISPYMRAYALKYMDWAAKIQEYWDFVEEVSSSQQKG